jgi:uncharacterized protein YceK
MGRAAIVGLLHRICLQIVRLLLLLGCGSTRKEVEEGNKSNNTTANNATISVFANNSTRLDRVTKNSGSA